MTRLLRRAGHSLPDSIDLTGRILDGFPVVTPLPQFADLESARTALTALGVEHVEQVRL